MFERHVLLIESPWADWNNVLEAAPSALTGVHELFPPHVFGSAFGAVEVAHFAAVRVAEHSIIAEILPCLLYLTGLRKGGDHAIGFQSVGLAASHFSPRL